MLSATTCKPLGGERKRGGEKNLQEMRGLQTGYRQIQYIIGLKRTAAGVDGGQCEKWSE